MNIWTEIENLYGVDSKPKIDLSTLGNEVANFFYDESIYIDGFVHIKKWENFIDGFFEKIKKYNAELFKTEDDLERILVSIDLSKVKVLLGISIGEQFRESKGFLEFPCLAILHSSKCPDIYPPIEYVIFKSSVHLADHFKFFGFVKVQFEGEFNFNSDFSKKCFAGENKRSEDTNLYLEFSECVFYKNQFFRNLFLDNSRIDFFKSIFKEDVDFSYSKLSNRIGFDGVKFEKNAYFQELGFLDPSISTSFDDNSEKTLTNKISFKNSIFKGSAYLTQEEENNLRVEICLAGAIFEGPVIFDLKFLECPDFSETFFLKSKIINETWQIDEQKILPTDEPKFRFLKKYFAEQGNHSKEQQYFAYEMISKKKRLDVEGGADLFLFGCYKWFSNFGMSVSLPFAWICMSFAVFFDIFLLLGCDLISALTSSFARTVNPLIKFDGFFKCIDKETLSNGLIAVLSTQTVVNTILIFLLILGLRNKFKIK